MFSPNISLPNSFDISTTQEKLKNSLSFYQSFPDSLLISISNDIINLKDEQKILMRVEENVDNTI